MRSVQELQWSAYRCIDQVCILESLHISFSLLDGPIVMGFLVLGFKLSCMDK